MAKPVFTLEWSPTTRPAETPVWVNISSRLMWFDLTRGRQNEYDRIEMGQLRCRLKNDDRAFDAKYTAGIYYPNVKQMKRFRLSATIDAITYRLFTGYLQDLPRRRRGNTWAEVEILCVDGFEQLRAAPLVSSFATLTTALTGTNNDLAFTAVARGAGGNAITVSYVVAGTNTPLTVSVAGTAITVNVATDGAGAATSTAADVMSVLNTNVNSSALIVAALASGNDGTGIVTALAATALAGGTFVQQLSGARINAALDAVSHLAAERSIDAGQSVIPASTFDPEEAVKVLDHVQDVAVDAELGLFFMRGDGFAIFRDRHALLKVPYTTSQGVFSDKPVGSELPYADIVPINEARKIVNDWTITREGDATGVQKVDPTSQLDYFPRADAKTILVTSVAEAEAQAEFRLARTKEPLQRYERVKLRPGDNTNLWKQVLGREIGDRITVKESPPGGGSANVEDAHIQGIQLECDQNAGDATCEWSLFGADASGYLVLDDATNGKLDTGKLAY